MLQAYSHRLIAYGNGIGKSGYGYEGTRRGRQGYKWRGEAAGTSNWRCRGDPVNQEGERLK